MNNEGVGVTDGIRQDEYLLAQYRLGDPNAYGLLYDKYRKYAFSLAFTYTQSKEHAEDLVLESFTRILEAIRRGNGPTVSMGHYLRSTIRSIAIDSGERSSREELVDPDELTKLYERENFQDEIETAAWIGEAFNRLSPRSQEIMWRRVIEGVPSQQLAKSLNTSGAAITRAYQSAVREFREGFVDYSVNESRDEACRKYAPMLRALARADSKKRGTQPDAELNAHLVSCAHCTAITNRLSADVRVLLSALLISGLGVLASQSLQTTSAAAATNAFSALTLPVKLGLVMLPIVAGAIATVALTSALSPALPSGESSPLYLGEVTSEEATVIQMGDCRVEREVLEQDSEVWRLVSSGTSCAATIQYRGEGDAAWKEYRLGQASPIRLSAVEIARPGEWTVTVSADQQSETLSIEVKRPRP